MKITHSFVLGALALAGASIMSLSGASAADPNSIFNFGGLFAPQTQQQEAQTASRRFTPAMFARAELGFGWAEDADFHDHGTGSISDSCIGASLLCGGRLDHLGSGVVLGGALGLQPVTWYKTELEIAYRGGYKLKDHDQSATVVGYYSANYSNTAFMFNNYLMLPVSPNMTPFVGFGVGGAENNMSSVHYTGFIFPTSSGTMPGGNRFDFAWQVMTGLDVPISDHWTFNVTARHFDGGGVHTHAGTFTDTSVAGQTSVTYKGMQGNFITDEILTGISYRF